MIENLVNQSELYYSNIYIRIAKIILGKSKY